MYIILEYVRYWFGDVYPMGINYNGLVGGTISIDFGYRKPSATLAANDIIGYPYTANPAVFFCFIKTSCYTAAFAFTRIAFVAEFKTRSSPGVSIGSYFEVLPLETTPIKMLLPNIFPASTSAKSAP